VSSTKAGAWALRAVVLLAGAFALRRLDDPDTWFHLATGRWVYEHASVPFADPFSRTAAGKSWVDVEWLYDLLMYGAHVAGGADAVVLVSAASFAAAVWVLGKNLQLSIGVSGAALLALWVTVIAEGRARARPESMSFLLLEIVLFLVASHRAHGGRRVFLLPVVMAAWANVHAQFAIGWMYILAALAGAAFAGGFRTRIKDRRAFFVAAVAALLAPLVNPYGLEGVLYPYRLATQFNFSEWPFSAISELEDPFSARHWTPEFVAYATFLGTGGFLVAGAVAFAVIRGGSARGREGDAPQRDGSWDVLLPDVLLFSALALLSLDGIRHMALFALGSAPAVARCLRRLVEVLPRRQRMFPRFAQTIPAASVLTVALVATGVVATNGFSAWRGARREFGLGSLEGAFPSQAAAFAREAKLPGNAFNDIAAGSYLVWDPAFSEGVHVDGRLEVYGSEFLSTVLVVVLNPRGWQIHADRYEIQTVFLARTQTPLGRSLLRDRRWVLVYFDEASLVFVRRLNEDAVERARSLFPRWRQETEERLRGAVSGRRRPTARAAALIAYGDRLVAAGHADDAPEFYSRALDLANRYGFESGARERLESLERGH
jgi:hypothetical protein